MLLLDEMLALNLLTADQHTEIGAWVRQARTPDRILQMPASAQGLQSHPGSRPTAPRRGMRGYI